MGTREGLIFSDFLPFCFSFFSIANTKWLKRGYVLKGRFLKELGGFCASCLLIISYRTIAVCKWLRNDKAFVCGSQNFSMVLASEVLFLFYCASFSGTAGDVSLWHFCSPVAAKLGQRWLLWVVLRKSSCLDLANKFVIYAQRRTEARSFLSGLAQYSWEKAQPARRKHFQL